MQTSLTEDQRALPKYSQRLPEAIREYFARPGEARIHTSSGPLVLLPEDALERPLHELARADGARPSGDDRRDQFLGEVWVNERVSGSDVR